LDRLNTESPISNLEVCAMRIAHYAEFFSNISACKCYQGKGYGYYCGYELGCGGDSLWYCPGYGATARYVGYCDYCCNPPGENSYCC
ncbi:5483_t:CDS:2, partial [Scutellospora calospora]